MQTRYKISTLLLVILSSVRLLSAAQPTPAEQLQTYIDSNQIDAAINYIDTKPKPKGLTGQHIASIFKKLKVSQLEKLIKASQATYDILNQKDPKGYTLLDYFALKSESDNHNKQTKQFVKQAAAHHHRERPRQCGKEEALGPFSHHSPLHPYKRENHPRDS